MKMLTCIAALGAALMLAGAVHAAPSAIAETCKADVKQFCADVKPGAGKLTACIKCALQGTFGGLPGRYYPNRGPSKGLQVGYQVVVRRR